MNAIQKKQYKNNILYRKEYASINLRKDLSETKVSKEKRDAGHSCETCTFSRNTCKLTRDCFCSLKSKQVKLYNICGKHHVVTL